VVLGLHGHHLRADQPQDRRPAQDRQHQRHLYDAAPLHEAEHHEPAEDQRDGQPQVGEPGEQHVEDPAQVPGQGAEHRAEAAAAATTSAPISSEVRAPYTAWVHRSQPWRS